MRIIILVDHLGGRPPGPYLIDFIDKLSFLNEITVITSECNQSVELSRLKAIITIPRAKLNPLKYKFLICALGAHPYDFFWSRKSASIFKRQQFGRFDLLLSFIGSNSLYLFQLANSLKKTERLKHAVYLSDAIPAPGWPEHPYVVNGLRRFIRKSLSNIDALFTLNKEMLSYQISTFIPKPIIITGTFPFGCRSHLLDYPNYEKGTNYFLYAGSIYGARKPNYLLMAFEKLLDLFPSSKLIFIGTWKDNPPFHGLRISTINNIISLPFQENLNSYFRKATALINIDADIPQDVFLSSKIGDYLPVNRIIINETGESSPSRNLFKGIQSIIHCDHDSTQLFEAMKFSISMKNSMDYEDRKPLIEELYIDNVASRFNETLRQLYDEK